MNIIAMLQDWLLRITGFAKRRGVALEKDRTRVLMHGGTLVAPILDRNGRHFCLQAHTIHPRR